MRTLPGGAQFTTIRSYLATVAKHGITLLHALTLLTEGAPGFPKQPETHPQAASTRPATASVSALPVSRRTLASVRGTAAGIAGRARVIGRFGSGLADLPT